MISSSELSDENPLVEAIQSLFPFLDMKNGPWIGGGCGRKLFEGYKALGESDIDVFFKNEDMQKWAVSFFKSAKSINGWYIKDHQESPAWNMFTATYNRDDANSLNSIKIQFLKKKFFGSVEELFDDFDFTICMFATDGYELAADQRAIDDLSRKSLVLHQKPPKPKAARLAKYCAMGFVPTPGVVTAMFGVDTDKFFPTPGLVVDEY